VRGRYGRTSLQYDGRSEGMALQTTCAFCHVRTRTAAKNPPGVRAQSTFRMHIFILHKLGLITPPQKKHDPPTTTTTTTTTKQGRRRAF
jgi:hypothetical protein